MSYHSPIKNPSRTVSFDNVSSATGVLESPKTLRAKIGSLDPANYESAKSNEVEAKKDGQFTIKTELLPIEAKGKKVSRL